MMEICKKCGWYDPTEKDNCALPMEKWPCVFGSDFKSIKEEPVNKFKIGDRVRVSNIELTNYGRSGKIELIDGSTYCLSGVGWYSRENLELIKESPMQYESTGKAISLQAVEEAGPKNCDEFQRGLERFAFLLLSRCSDPRTAWRNDEPLLCLLVTDIAAQIPGATKFLLDKGFIREKRPDLKVDAPVLVSNHRGASAHLKRHFSHWDGDRMACYDNGLTSFTSGENTCAWDYWKLPEETE